MHIAKFPKDLHDSFNCAQKCVTLKVLLHVRGRLLVDWKPLILCFNFNLVFKVKFFPVKMLYCFLWNSHYL